MSAFELLNDKNKNITCCFTGHRPDDLPWGTDQSLKSYESFYRRLTEAISTKIQAGYKIFLNGMARGVDLMAAQIVLGLREGNPKENIRFIAVCPFENQSRGWPKEQKIIYANILKMADEKIVISEEYRPYCFHERNRFMVDNSAHLIAGYNGRKKGGTCYTVKYAKKKGLDITIVPPEEVYDLFSVSENWENR